MPAITTTYDTCFDGDDGGGNTMDYAVYNNIEGRLRTTVIGATAISPDADGVY